MKKHRNPSFPTGLLIGAVLGAGGLIWWATRKPAASAAQAASQEGGAASSMSYAGTSHPLYNPPPGSAALTPEQLRLLALGATGMTSGPYAGIAGSTLTNDPIDPAMLAQARANFARVNPQ